MPTSRNPVSKKPATKKSTTTAGEKLPASTTKAAPKAIPKTRAKTTSVPASTPAAPRTRQVKLKPDTTVTSKPRAAKKAPAKKLFTPEERYQMIVTAAYFLAERHGFSSGHALDDWVAAEKEIDNRLKAES